MSGGGGGGGGVMTHRFGGSVNNSDASERRDEMFKSGSRSETDKFRPVKLTEACKQ